MVIRFFLFSRRRIIATITPPSFTLLEESVYCYSPIDNFQPDSLLIRLKTDQKTYMRGRTQPDLAVVKSILSDYMYLGKSDNAPPTPDAGILTVLQRSMKKRQESISQYKSAGRQDLVDQEEKELEILKRYMPTQMTDDEIQDEVHKVVQQIGAASIKDLGKVMKAWNIDGALADRKKVSDMVKSVLSGQ
jgi:uncharacterized protein YqeY